MNLSRVHDRDQSQVPTPLVIVRANGAAASALLGIV